MKSISSKLFLSMIGLTSIVLIATLLLARWSFETGFIDYVTALEQRRLRSMADELAEHYVSNDRNWNNMTSEVFEGVIEKWNPRPGPPGSFGPKPFDQARLGDRPPPRREDHLRQGFDGQPPPNHDARRPPPRRDAGNPPTRRFGRSPKDIAPEDRAHPDIEHLPEGRLPLPSNKRGGSGEPPDRHPTMLVDSQGKHVAGQVNLPRDDYVVRVPVTAGDENIGELRTVAKVRTDSSLETEFSKQQTRASMFISLVSLILAGLASWGLVRLLVAPVLQIKQGVVRLASGDYSSRLSVERDDELGTLMSDLDRLAVTLEQNRNSRKRWLADISHELRTPVTILAGEIEAIKDGLRPMDMNQMESLDHEVARLRHLINDLYELSLSDIGGLRYEFANVDPVQLLESVLDQNQIRLEQAQITASLTVGARATMQADVNRLEQLFTNLLNNSIAYTDKGGEIRIVVRTEGTLLIIEFDDSAPGVSNKAFEQMFEPLYREDESRSRRVAGAGLGLTIAKNIVLAHHGQISASASALGGVSIKLEFPIGDKQ